MPSLPENCLNLRVYIDENLTYGPLPLYEALVLEARRGKIAGATVFRGHFAYGQSNMLPGARDMQLSDSPSVLVDIIDEAEKVQALLPWIRKTLGKRGLATVAPVMVVHSGAIEGEGE